MRGDNLRFWGLCVCAGLLSILTGCASVTHGTSQTVKIETLSASGQVIDGAECRVSNDKAEILVLSGQSAPVRRSGANLSIDCAQAGYPAASGQAISRANPGMVGNILIGGGIGAAIDASSGAGFSYPSWIQLVFGEVRSFDRNSQQGDLPLAGIHLGTTAESAVAGKAPETTASAPARTLEHPLNGPASPRAVSMPSPVAVLDAPLSSAASLRRGDALEYALTDRVTMRKVPAVYRLDRIIGDELSFNMGGRIEKKDGQVVSITAPLGGLFDTSSPPGGWGRKDLKPGMRWHVDFVATSGEKWRHELDAVVIGGERSMRVDGTEIKAVQIAYAGWIYVSYGSGSSAAGTPFEATVWYSNEMGRVVRFEGEHRRSGSSTKDSLELVRVLR